MGGLMLALGLFAASAPITLTSPDKFTFAPADIRVHIIVEPHADNRRVCLEYDGGDYSRSCWDHDGENAPRAYTRTLKRLSAGAYVAAATVVRADGTYTVSRVEFEVLESLPQ